ncbi:MAG TPA: hypothetical protein DD791_14120 [Syntrophomonas sp.]|nr:hypothetical protein [Syntrophomonas sp.]
MLPELGQYNKPFLDEVISRGDEIILATEPVGKISKLETSPCLHAFYYFKSGRKSIIIACRKCKNL